ncbi:orotate phosphoribosyltransferase [Lottiidibacillus patelloidae]|uniref:Orotate phosphoribosyltransferase n=1 Tax=Lottiidibacillus patelloidae TaxID=2670334 RepID=A0A263BY77_9BACI|nr:orotate phosphoribosyltransferase [Lottiidibacillus patelloidae]OZM58532.1 orotate phosphoribosyltransferase [Lottiidibacillus patelloidae]
MKRKIAKNLLEIGAVTLSAKHPFIWSSGIKSPIYCDNRLTMSYPAVRKDIAKGLETLIKKHFANSEVIAGTATAGIPHAAWVSESMELPMVYVRSKAKGHGKENQIEGVIPEGKKVIIVEDLISTGGSVINAAHALKQLGAEVLGVVSIFTYELEIGKKRLAEEQLSWYALTDFETLLAEAKSQNEIDQDAYDSMLSWKRNPERWGV